MLIRRISVALVSMLIASSAFALDVKELLSLVAMPLAVAAASDVNGVQQNDLVDLVSQLNQANVPPSEFVQIVRYVPVALIDQNGQPQIVQYVTTETTRGITGPRLATSVADELRMRYDVPRFDLTPTVVDTTVPEVVTTRVNNDLLSLVTMPVVVAAAADIAGVPQQELMNLVAQLNQANVPPAQFVEVVHYVPVALVDTNTAPQFVDYVTTQVNNGVTGPQLATVVADRLRTQYRARDINVVAPRVQRVVVEQPAPVQQVQVAHVHPHGGPPGQLKKVYGYQTGAEVVHGGMPPGQAKKVNVAHEHGHGNGHGRGHQQVVVPQPMISSAPIPMQPQQMPGPPMKQHGNPHGGPPGNPGHGNDNGNGNGNGHGNGHGKGKG